MAISKVTFNGDTLMDVTDDNPASGTMFTGVQATGANGQKVQGSYTAPTQRTSSDVTVSGDTVSVPAGEYRSPVSKSVASGTAGTPTATKGSVSNHSVQVTPSVTNQTGYITGGTKTGTPVTVSASELVSGTLEITENGTDIDVTNYATVDVNVPTGSGTVEAEEKDVIFIDYDGTILYSYTKAEFANLSELPANPSHEGLTAQGWNWSLSDAKTYVASYGKLWIGQMYVTSDGKTKIKIRLDNPDLLSPYLKFAVNGTVVVDWGDNSATNTVTGTSLITSTYTPHTYAATGEYEISLECTSGSFTFYNQYILSHTNGTSNSSRRYNSSIIEVYLGSGVFIGNSAFSYCYSLQNITIPSGVTSIETYAFSNCPSLQNITIPSGVTSIGTYAFSNCYSLQSVTIPSGVTSIGNSAFSYCYSLQSVTIPSGVTFIGNSAFSNCYSLQSVTIPSGVTSIGNSAFASCFSLQSITIPSDVTSIGSGVFSNCPSLYKLVFKPTTPPTVANSNAFTSLPTDCTIYVPAGSLSAYTSATNYPASATYTYVEE